MLRFYARPFLEAHRLIHDLSIAVRDPNVHAFSDESRDHICQVLKALAKQLSDLELPMSRKSALDTLRRLGEVSAPNELRWFVDQLAGRLEDEIETSYILCLSPREANLYEPNLPLFGGEVLGKFPTDGAFEIDEAAKCLALGRPTAAVFHLMRVMELCIRAIARCLGIPDPIKPAERNWAIILKAIRNAIDGHWPTNAQRMAGDGQLFDELYASMAAVKSPWRDPTMHVEKKYTDDEAEHIFTAVKGFMKLLASRCDENGLPRAPLLKAPSSVRPQP